jgi:nucleoside-diphosphate-sugar epimerase
MKKNFKNKKVMVAGGTGFIGQHLVKRLLELGAHVVSISFTGKSIIDDDRLENIAADVLDKMSLKEKFGKEAFSYVFNLAGYVNHASLNKGGRSLIEAHYIGLMNLIEIIDKPCLRGFVQIGSSDEYGGLPAPQVETMRESPISPYSAAKLAATHLIQMLNKTQGFPGSILRLFLVYGPGQGLQRFIPQVISGCLRNDQFPASEGHQLRDFCFITDVVDAMLLAITNPAAYGEVFNIASGNPVSIRSVLDEVCVISGGGGPKYGEIPYRNGENMALYADIDKARTLLGWQPEVPLNEGLSKTIDWYRQDAIKNKTSLVS